MKKNIPAILIAILLLFACIACGKVSESPAQDAPAQSEQTEAEGFITMADVMVYESLSSCCYEDLYIYVFEKDGKYLRADADIPADVYDKIEAIDFFADDYWEQTANLIKDLPIKNLYDLSAALPSKSEIDSLVGKTGKELTDMGFTDSGSFGCMEDMFEAYLNYGAGQYEVFFDGVVAYEDGLDVEAAIQNLTVKSIAFNGLSDACTDRDFTF